MKLLLIGYGNELRGDDAAGPALARAVAEAGWPDVEALAVHQLLPELAEPIARADRVLFADADRTAPRVRWRRLRPAAGSAFTAHLSDPTVLLALAQTLYQRCPPAWLIGIPACQFTFGAGLSPVTRQSVTHTIETIHRLCLKFGSGASLGPLL